MILDVLTLFPEMFPPVTEHSILGKANEKELLDIRLHNIRDYTLDKHNRTDDSPYGGGAGMVMSAEPVFRALEAISAEGKRILYMSPKGKLLDQSMIEDLSGERELVIVCGHYEGIDQRIIDHWGFEEISIGDYILTGGELPAMVLIDTVARMIPNVLGSSDSHKEESVYSGLLEYPHYTKPREYKDMPVPEVLVSGNHKMIHLWRYQKSLEITFERRPDIFLSYINRVKNLSKDESKILSAFISEKQIKCDE